MTILPFPSSGSSPVSSRRTSVPTRFRKSPRFPIESAIADPARVVQVPASEFAPQKEQPFLSSHRDLAAACQASAPVHVVPAEYMALVKEPTGSGTLT